MRIVVMLMLLILVACSHRIEVPRQNDIPNPEIGTITPGGALPLEKEIERDMIIIRDSLGIVAP